MRIPAENYTLSTYLFFIILENLKQKNQKNIVSSKHASKTPISHSREFANLAISHSHFCNFSVDIQRNKKLRKSPNQCRRIGYSKLGKDESPLKNTIIRK